MKLEKSKDQATMPTLLHNLKQSFKELVFMCLALLLTPGIVTVASVCLLFQLDLTVALTRFLDFGTSREMMIAALLTVATGMTVYLGIALVVQRKPLLVEILVIALSQVISLLAATAALVHNPQEEFCQASSMGSALAKAYQLDSCNLTHAFWMQLGVGGLVVAVFCIVLLSLGRSVIHAISK